MYKKFEAAARMQSPETIPIHIGILTSVWLKYGDELTRVMNEYPQFFATHPDMKEAWENISANFRKGQTVDTWGCVWSNIMDGNNAYVTGHPIKSEEDIFSLQIPDDRSGDDLPHGFFYLRLLDLCGFELAMTLFADGDEALRVLIDKVLTYDCYQIEAMLKKHPDDWYIFADDLGMQHGLAVGPDRWRKYIKPAYAKMYGMIHKYNPNAAIYMHTDGCIWEIMPDLVEAGVTMINPQFRANGLENLLNVCRRKQTIPIHLDLDRQMFPFATPAQLQEHVRECVQSFYLPEGGLGLNIEINHDVPLENFVAILDALEKWRHYKG